MNGQLRLWDDSPVPHSVFFAARPGGAVAAQIESIAQGLAKNRRLAAKVLPSERLHVSLFAVGEFAGPPPVSAIEAAEAAASTVSMRPFTVVFDRVASFGGGSGKRALVLAGSDGVTGLERLRQTLSVALTKAGLGARDRRSFTPHMTIMYADQKCDMPIVPISWTVDEFVLIDSLIGQSRHDLLRRWPL